MLNWLARYAPAGAVLLEQGRATGSILDVGCGPHGLACAHPEVPFVGLDVEFPTTVAPSMVGIQAPAGPLPFADGAFHTVLSLDTLEHVPRPDRAGFVAELARVAARRVLLACPTEEGAALDAMVRRRIEGAGHRVPSWLAEHDEHVLPSRAEVEGFAAAIPGFTGQPWPMVNGLLAGLLPWADLFEFASQAAAESAERREEWVRLLEGAAFGPSFRGGWILERSEARESLIGANALPHEVAAALRCLACGATHACVDAELLACTGCGRGVGRAPSRAWRLEPVPASQPGSASVPEATSAMAGPVSAADPAMPAGGSVPAPAAIPENAPVQEAGPVPPTAAPRELSLLLTPEWERPETWLGALSAYISGAAPSAPVVLYVDAATDLGLETAASLMGAACERLAGEAAFAEVVLLPAGEAPPAGAVPVTDAVEVRAALGVPNEDNAALDAEQLVDRARWAKGLADALRDAAERRRFVLAPEPWADREPLVTVRIPTWKGVDGLVGRAIPSVLGGAYRNVEVVVCSDGPDPACRAAVAAVGDRRVRYVELDERPVYAQHPRSFWETAGIRAVNTALDHARGGWIAPLDHDDAFTHDHIAALLGGALQGRRDMVYGQALIDVPGGAPVVLGSPQLHYGGICHGSAIYSPRLRHLRYDEHAWLIGEPGDWNLWRRMAEMEAPIGHLPRVILSRQREGTSLEAKTAEGGGWRDRDAGALAEDILGTSAAWLLDVHPMRVRAAA